MDVVVLRWPTDASRRQDLIGQGLPRLLLVEGQSPPPAASDCLEDWVRVPVAEADLALRLSNVARRAAAHCEERPSLDEDGVLRYGPGWVPLPPVECRLTNVLLDQFGAVVSRDSMARAGWPEGAPGRNALDVHVLRLRRRIRPLGLAIRTVRSRGYLLEHAHEGAAREVAVANLA